MADPASATDREALRAAADELLELENERDLKQAIAQSFETAPGNPASYSDSKKEALRDYESTKKKIEEKKKHKQHLEQRIRAAKTERKQESSSSASGSRDMNIWDHSHGWGQGMPIFCPFCYVVLPGLVSGVSPSFPNPKLRLSSCRSRPTGTWHGRNGQLRDRRLKSWPFLRNRLPCPASGIALVVEQLASAYTRHGQELLNFADRHHVCEAVFLVSCSPGPSGTKQNQTAIADAVVVFLHHLGLVAGVI